jgi:hypothetical protein
MGKVDLEPRSWPKFTAEFDAQASTATSGLFADALQLAYRARRWRGSRATAEAASWPVPAGRGTYRVRLSRDRLRDDRTVREDPGQDLDPPASFASSAASTRSEPRSWEGFALLRTAPPFAFLKIMPAGAASIDLRVVGWHGQPATRAALSACRSPARH